MANLVIIRQAMEAQPSQMIGFSYVKKNGALEQYTVEPYEIDEMGGIFWGFKINDPNPGIRKFTMGSMSGEMLLPQVFTPRWTLFPYGKI